MNEELNEYDKYFICWWNKNKEHFDYFIKDEKLDNGAVHLICGLSHLLGGALEINSSTAILLHSYLSDNRYVNNG